MRDVLNKLEFFGVAQFKLRPLKAGALELSYRQAIPFKRLLNHAHHPDHLNRFKELTGKAPATTLIGIGEDQESVSWLIDKLKSDSNRPLDQIIERLSGDFNGVRRIYKKVTGNSLTRKQEFYDLDAEIKSQLLTEISKSTHPNDPEHVAIRKILFQRLSNLVEKEVLTKAIDECLALDATEGNIRYYSVKPKDPKHQFIDMVTPDRLHRFIVTRREKEWRVIYANAEKQDSFTRNFEATELEEAHLSDNREVLSWIIQKIPEELLAKLANPSNYLSAQTHLTFSKSHRLTPIHLKTSPLEEVLLVKATYLSPSDYGPRRSSISYDTKKELDGRARSLEIKGRSKLSAEELRMAISQRAIELVPGAELIGKEVAGYVRNIGGKAEAGDQVVNPEYLESLVCHTLSSGYLHKGIPPQASRLGYSIASKQVYAPLNPFTKFPGI